MAAKKTTIVTADDDPRLLRLVSRNLELEGYEVIATQDGEQALQAVETRMPDLVLLDVMMPKMDGFTVCTHIREFSTVPVIVMTARGQDKDKVLGLDLGADDYLTKPFSVDELLARIRAVLRRTSFAVTESKGMQPPLRIGELTIDYTQHQVKRGAEEILLTPVEYRLFVYMARNVGRVLTHDQLLEHVWGSEYLGESHMLQVNMNRLRHKIEPNPAQPRYLLTRIGVGYTFVDPQPTQSAS
ncbi:DNA-binding response regulator [Ktedonobacter sp. SOSP1-85]|uniref:response regulator transcription factor n=1 Tax=Ktedonobacter sp. SOSP1-85 TaxID=2778367 RepID=UPI0019155E28|nr:response regulator transcription factor [Ktedonobacter sp. SOSP1-85]GHO77625.1 DNA-binding response regulator [Ktedonobacter sp. SOSP1-85]